MLLCKPMSYQFEATPIYEDEHLNHNGSFKKYIDNIIRKSQCITYVGWRNNFSFFDYYYSLVEQIFIIEIWQNHVDQFEKKYYNIEIICNNICNFENLITEKQRDCLLWQQGPEHLEMKQAKNLINQMKKTFSKIIIETPNGQWEQGPDGDNIYETHLSYWYPENYEELGFTYTLFGGTTEHDIIIGYWEK